MAYNIAMKIKRTYRIEEKHDKTVKKTAKKQKQTHSAIIRNLIETLK